MKPKELKRIIKKCSEIILFLIFISVFLSISLTLWVIYLAALAITGVGEPFITLALYTVLPAIMITALALAHLVERKIAIVNKW